jgi:hypothetical protein
MGYSPNIIIPFVHKFPSGFWKIMARKQIELATCGLRQIIENLWKFFFLLPQQLPYAPSLRFPVSCLLNGYCAETRALGSTGTHVPRQDIFRKMEGSPHRGLLKPEKTSSISLWSSINRIWLAQFHCAPQFFETPKGLGRHTVLREVMKFLAM